VEGGDKSVEDGGLDYRSMKGSIDI